MSMILRSDGSVLFERVTVPRSFLSRARGLIGRPPLSDGEAWWFANCRAVHMVGMRIPMDVAFVDAQGLVTKVVNRLAPFAVAWSPSARHAVEMAAGTAQRIGLRPGDHLSLSGAFS